MNSVEVGLVMNEDPIDIILLQNIQAKAEKFKLGEIFRLQNDSIIINCIHCLQEFQYFTEFTLHIEGHYMSGEIERLNAIHRFDPDPSIETVIKEEFDIPPKSEEAGDILDNDVESLDHSRNEVNSMGKEGTTDKDSTLASGNKIFVFTPLGKIENANDVSNEDVFDDEKVRRVVKGSEHQKNTFQCLACHRKYSNKRSFRQHMQIKHEPKRYSCSLCLMRFPRDDYVERHIRRVHDINDLPLIKATISTPPKKEGTERTLRKLECFICHRQYSGRFSLRQHMQIKHEPTRFSCSLCSMRFPRDDYVERHIRKVHGPKDLSTINAAISHSQTEPTTEMDLKKKFVCLVCNGQYSSKVSLTNHIREIHEPKRFSCSLCLKCFARPGNIRGHIEKVHGVSEPDSIKNILVRRTKESSQITLETLDCQVCHRKYATKDLLNQHMGLVHGHQQKRFECFICHRQVSTSMSLRRHLQYGHGPKQFFCPLCPLYFARPGNARKHIHITHGVSEEFSIDAISVARKSSETYKSIFDEHLKRKFECYDCHRPFAALTLLRFHIGRAHGAQSKAKLFSCPLCLARITRLKNVQSHIKRIHGMSYTSKEVLAAQPKSEELNQKIREHKNESKLKPVKKCICDICGLAFNQLGNLKSHMDSHRNGNKFKCEVCNKTVSAQYGPEHMQIHTGEKKQQCTICGKRFLNKKRLRNHMIGHVDKPNYKCDICAKAFIRPYKLVEHRRLHAEEMPHVCKTCNVGFMSFDSLRKHQYKHERDESVVKDASGSAVFDDRK